MTNNDIVNILKNELAISGRIVALKFLKEEPSGIRKYEERAFPGLCTQIKEILDSGETFYTVKDQCFCTGGVVAAGVADSMTREEKKEMVKLHMDMEGSYKDIETAMAYYDHVEKIIPYPKERNTAIQLGLFPQISDPHILLIFCNPKKADILSRNYVYTTGDLIKGFGGNGGCTFNIQYPYATGKPAFSYSDVAWRKYTGISDDEITLSFPYDKLKAVIGNLPEIAKKYNNYGEPPEL